MSRGVLLRQQGMVASLIRPTLLAVLMLGCTSADRPPVATQTAPLEELTDRYFEPETRLRFSLREGVNVEARHYDPTLPLKKFRHSLQLITADGVAVVIDVWDNPTHRELHDWFSEYLAFLIDRETKVSEREVTNRKLQAILLEQPRSEQAISMAVAVFAHREQIFRVTCIDSDGDGSALPRALFESLLHDLELEARP